MAHRDTSRWLSVASQQGEDIVLAVVASLGDEAQVRWVGSTVGIPSCLLIRIRAWQGVAQTARPAHQAGAPQHNQGC